MGGVLAVRASLCSLSRLWNAKCKLLSPFLLSAVQRRLITTPAEAPNLPPSTPPQPSFAGRHSPQFALLPCYVYGEPGSMDASGTDQTTAVVSPYSRKNLKGNCTAGSITSTAATPGTW